MIPLRVAPAMTSLEGGAGNDTIILESNGAFGSELYAYNDSPHLSKQVQKIASIWRVRYALGM